MPFRLGRCTWLAAAGGVLLVGCGRPTADEGVTPAIRVFAASSLTAPFQALAHAFEQQPPGQRIELHFAGTPQLVLQIREGAAVDVFAAADEPNMQKVIATGKTVAPPVEFARNRLAIVVAAGNPRGVRGLADLARTDLKVALCGPHVPAGRYAREVLQRAKVVVASVSDEPNVKALVTKVQLGELDAGVVYATDTRGDGVTAVPIASEHDLITSYPIVVLGAGSNRAGGDNFVDFVRSAAGRAILAEHGFLLP